MNEEKFWKLIESCVVKGPSACISSLIEHYNRISATLGHLSLPELTEFVSIFYRMRDQARSVQMAQAAFIFSHGLTDGDTVDGFLTGVIMQGRRVYVGCLQNPESTILSLEWPKDLMMYAFINIAFEEMHKNIFGNSDNSLVPYNATLDEYAQDPRCTENFIKLEMPKLFNKYW